MRAPAAPLPRGIWLLVALLGSGALLLRMWALGSVPGINGDEAWYGLRIIEWGQGNAGWLTPTGNPLNPFFLAPTALAQVLFRPALWSLRVAAVLSGVLTVVVAFVVGRRLWSAPVALVIAALVAFLPQSIAYSRFGWDASQSALFVWLLLAAAQGGRILLSLAALIIALWVHPTNVFAAPAALALLGLRLHGQGRLSRRTVLVTAALGLVAAVVVFMRFRHLLPWQTMVDNSTSLARWGESGRLWVQLLSGTTIYRYISGAGHGADALVLDLLWGALLLFTLVLAPLWAWRRRRWELIACAAGVVLGLVGFQLLVGPKGAVPGFERYLLWLVAPVLFNLGLQLEGWLGERLRWRQAAIAAGLVAAVGALSFANNYFFEFARTGGRSHRTFRTTSVEPKRAAYDLWRRDRATMGKAGSGAVRVLASSWWSYQTFRYLMASGGDLARGDAIELLKRGKRMRLGAARYWLTYPGEVLHRVAQGVPQHIEKRYTIKDPRGRPILFLYRLRRPSRTP